MDTVKHPPTQVPLINTVCTQNRGKPLCVAKVDDGTEGSTYVVSVHLDKHTNTTAFMKDVVDILEEKVAGSRYIIAGDFNQHFDLTDEDMATQTMRNEGFIYRKQIDYIMTAIDAKPTTTVKIATLIASRTSMFQRTHRKKTR